MAASVVTGPPGEPRAAARVRRRRPRRWWVPVAGVIVLLGIAGTLSSQVAPAPVPAAHLPPAQVANAATASAQSTVWYCPGGGLSGTAQATATLLVLNTGNRARQATLTVVDRQGSSDHRALSLPPRTETAQTPAAVVHGQWLASRLVVDGGGVTVSERLTGAGGWTMAPCTSTTSARWYFADGTTATGNSLSVAVYNPTSTLAVADITFYAGPTAVEPVPYQGMVIPPGHLMVADVGAYVQNRTGIAAVVSTRSGTVVADELQAVDSGGVSGISLRAGSPAPAAGWEVPRAVDSGGGATNIAVFNPSSTPERVRVRVLVPSHAVVPFSETVAAHASWIVTTGQQIRIPLGRPWSARVRASGAGVVVERVEQASGAAPAPQWGLATGLPSEAVQLGHRWIVPSPLATGEAAATAPATLTVDLVNPGTAAVHVRLYRVRSDGLQPLGGRRTLPPGAAAAVPAGSHDPVEVVADGPVGVSGDTSSVEAPGVLTVPAFPVTGT